MLGLSKDPDFKNNHWIYIYYSPFDSSVNRLSRCSFENDTILSSSEKIILEVKSHSGKFVAIPADPLPLGRTACFIFLQEIIQHLLTNQVKPMSIMDLLP